MSMLAQDYEATALYVSEKQDSREISLAESLKKQGFPVDWAKLVDVYTTAAPLSDKEKPIVLDTINCRRPGIQKLIFEDEQPPEKFDWAIELGFLPGVTDNVGSTAREMILDALGRPLEGSVHNSRILYLNAGISRKEAEQVALSLVNPIIQRYRIKNFYEFKKEGGFGIRVPRVKLDQTPGYLYVNLDVSDEELKLLGKEGIMGRDGRRRGPLALDLESLHVTRDYFRKEYELGIRSDPRPTDVELESVAQRWSEHCKHRIFSAKLDEIEDGLFKHYIKRATQDIIAKRNLKEKYPSIFWDNAGGILVHDEWSNPWIISAKVETHNFPSALEPFGGAITGIVGVYRDIMGFGIGAWPFAGCYFFFFGDPGDKRKLYRGPDFTQEMLSPERLMDGVIDGVRVGGNCSGIPTPQGGMLFEERYRGRPLVFVGVYGAMPAFINGKPAHEKKAQPGDYIVMVGGRVGIDGTHGATSSSKAVDSGSPATAVQIGDPITQRKTMDAIIKEAQDRGLYTSITDNGAGGLSCSVGEMARESNGCHVYLEKVPLKYPGPDPWQIWVSESQERMTLSVPKEKWQEFQELMKSRGVEATVIGEFSDNGRCVVEYNNQKVMDASIHFLEEGIPKLKLKSNYTPPEYKEPELAQPFDFNSSSCQILSRLNIGNQSFVSTRFDHEVQGGSVIKPIQGVGRVKGDATVSRPLVHSNLGIAFSQAVDPMYGDFNTYSMAACSIVSAVEQIIAVGGDLDHISLLDNSCWCSSEDPFRLGQLKEAARACYELATALGTPFISGKDSMSNDFEGYDEKGKKKISIPPTLLITGVGEINDSRKCISLDAKAAGDFVYVLGKTRNELAGSEYFYMNNEHGGHVPSVTPELLEHEFIPLYRKISEAINEGWVQSCQGLGKGGLAVALSKCAIGGQLGLNLNLGSLPTEGIDRDDYMLFSESRGRFLITVKPEYKGQFEQLMKDSSFALAGKVTKQKKLTIRGLSCSKIIDSNLDDLNNSYNKPFKHRHYKSILDPVLIPPQPVDYDKFGVKLPAESTAKILLMSGYGINCELESRYAWEEAGRAIGMNVQAEIVHINDLIAGRLKLEDYHALMFPGGFSYGDDTGSGNAFAKKIRSKLMPQIKEFISKGKLVLGVCNGCQIGSILGIAPALGGKYEQQVDFTYNNSGTYENRPVTLTSTSDRCVFTKGMHGRLDIPVAHGEGRFDTDTQVLEDIEEQGLVAFRYSTPDGKAAEGSFPLNPNGSANDVAGITNSEGNVLIMMPHPERAVKFTQRPNWTLLKRRYEDAGLPVPEHGPGLKLFVNGLEYIANKFSK